MLRRTPGRHSRIVHAVSICGARTPRGPSIRERAESFLDDPPRAPPAGIEDEIGNLPIQGVSRREQLVDALVRILRIQHRPAPIARRALIQEIRRRAEVDDEAVRDQHLPVLRIAHRAAAGRQYDPPPARQNHAALRPPGGGTPLRPRSRKCREYPLRCALRAPDSQSRNSLPSSAASRWPTVDLPDPMKPTRKRFSGTFIPR